MLILISNIRIHELVFIQSTMNFTIRRFEVLKFNYLHDLEFVILYLKCRKSV